MTSPLYLLTVTMSFSKCLNVAVYIVDHTIQQATIPK